MNPKRARRVLGGSLANSPRRRYLPGMHWGDTHEENVLRANRGSDPLDNVVNKILDFRNAMFPNYTRRRRNLHSNLADSLSFLKCSPDSSGAIEMPLNLPRAIAHNNARREGIRCFDRGENVGKP